MKGEEASAVKRDLLISFAFIAIGVLAIAKINAGGAEQVIGTASLTHATIPTLYGSLLILLAGSLFVGAVFKYLKLRAAFREESNVPEAPAAAEPDGVAAGSTAAEAGEEKAARKLIALRLWGTLALLVVYILLLPHVHFIPLTILFLAALFVLFGRRQPLKIAVASVVGGSAFYLLFIVLLNLPL